MKPIPLEAGRMVLSLKGRDRGRYFVVLSVPDEEHVLLADGTLRRAERPKRKKNKHVRPKPILFPELAQKLRAGQAVNNGELRRALGQVQAGTTTPTDKEGCGIVQE